MDIETENVGIHSDIQAQELKESNTVTISAYEEFVLDKSFYAICSLILLYAVINLISFYQTESESESLLIIGLILTAFILSLSLLLMVLVKKNNLICSKSVTIYKVMYLTTGLFIIFSDPQSILFLQSDNRSIENSSFSLLYIHSYLGSKYLRKMKKSFNFLSLIIVIVAFGMGLNNSISLYHHIIQSILLMVFIFSQECNSKKSKQPYLILNTQASPDFKIENPNTPLEEILGEIHIGVEKILNTNNSDPNTQNIHNKIIELLRNIYEKIRTTKNIYEPRIEVITKNMEEDERIYIEQEFFDIKPRRRASELNIMPQTKIIDYGISELSGVLKHLGKEWNFDTFFVSGCTDSPLLVVGKYAIKLYGLDEIYSIDEKVLDGFLKELEKKYLPNPYHNSAHAADVMCSFIFFLTNSRLSHSMNQLEWLAGIIANLAHDVGHQGRNNRYHVMSREKLAIRYNDISVLEMYHTSTLFHILSMPELNIFGELSGDAYIMIRKMIIEMILATDLAKHFDLVSYMRTKYCGNTDFSNRDTRFDLFKLCIKSADVGHAAKCLEIHQRWCKLIIEEFFAQGDLEKEKNIPVSMYCDRDKTNIPKSQVGFIKNIVFSLFSTLNMILESEDIQSTCIEQLRINEDYWAGLAKSRNLSLTNYKEEKADVRNKTQWINRKSLLTDSLPPLSPKKNEQ